jgi:hypothetical protein
MKMHPLRKLIIERVSTGLRRAAVTTCAKWAETYRVMGNPFPGPWQFEHHWWLLEMHDAEAPSLIGQKAAQLGFTEWALNKTFFMMDVHGLSVLYILPSSDDASDFSSGRFDKALELSGYLNNFFSNVKNVGHKRAGSSSLYVRGSNSRSKLKSIDTAFVVYDEMDEMNAKNISLVSHRQDGQRAETQQDLKISTPTMENKGINEAYKLSTQEHYYFKCPSCRRHIELSWPDSIVITADKETDPRLAETHLICNICKATLPHQTKKEWLKPILRGGTAKFIPTHGDRVFRGFYVNQLYSSTKEPSKLAFEYLKGKKDPTEETEFFNSSMGLPHAVEGAKITDKEIEQCTHDFTKGPSGRRYVRTMGIDVGGVNHYSIEEWEFDGHPTPGLTINDQAIPRVLDEGETSGDAYDFDELLRLIQRFDVDYCVIDAEPERRMALQFAQRLWGKVVLCDWQYSAQGRQMLKDDDEELLVKVNRTSWFDLALGRFRCKRIRLPRDLSEDYKNHIKVPQRIYKKDKYNNPVGFWDSPPNKKDHLALTRVYSEIALPFAYSQTQNVDMH